MRNFERANEISFFVLYVCDTTVVFFKLPYTPFGNKMLFRWYETRFSQSLGNVWTLITMRFSSFYVNNKTITVFTLRFQTPYEIKMTPSIASFTVFQFQFDFCCIFTENSKTISCSFVPYVTEKIKPIWNWPSVKKKKLV